METWLGSELCSQLLAFVVSLSDSVVSRERSPEQLGEASAEVRSFVEMLEELGTWIDEIPPLDQPMRFGNKAFRTWHGRLSERAEGLLSRVLLQRAEAQGEKADTSLASSLAPYLLGSFGDPTRIDYGTG